MQERIPLNLKPSEVIALPLTHRVFDHAWQMGQRWAGRDDWRARMQYLRENYDPAKVQPAYYCLLHQRLEDGAHRIQVAKERGDNDFPVQAYRTCHHERPVVYDTISKAVAAHSALRNKDLLWLAACRDKKWPHLAKNVDYADVQVLDVGSNSGYTCLRALYGGAASAIGIEIRPDMVRAAKQAARELGVPHRVDFIEADWLKWAAAPALCDIVHCMGLLHYFPVDQYLDALDRLAASARRTLAIELRMGQGTGEKLITVSGGQTAPTADLLLKRFAAAGMKVQSIHDIDKGRQLWIANR